MYMKAVSFLLIGILGISINDTIIKLLSDAYALHQLVFIRGAFALLIIVPPVLARLGIAVLRTARPGTHALRGLLIVLANLAFFTGLASLPLAEASAVIFVAPVLITIFSHYFLGEQIGVWRWSAVVIGLIGMICVVQPFSTQLELAFLWPLAAAVCYAGFTVTTRFLGRTESTASLAIYSTGSFVVMSIAMGLLVGDGSLANTGNPNLEFLLRAWRWPDEADFGQIAAIGILSAVIAVAMSAAYRAGEASFLAPFEYVNLPLVLLWGLLIFGEFPNVLALFGMALIISGGMIMIFRERVKSRRAAIPSRL
jgi:drug/metabolite transporter (DMT)-like permease